MKNWGAISVSMMCLVLFFAACGDSGGGSDSSSTNVNVEVEPNDSTTLAGTVINGQNVGSVSSIDEDYWIYPFRDGDNIIVRFTASEALAVLIEDSDGILAQSTVDPGNNEVYSWTNADDGYVIIALTTATSISTPYTLIASGSSHPDTQLQTQSNQDDEDSSSQQFEVNVEVESNDLFESADILLNGENAGALDTYLDTFLGGIVVDVDFWAFPVNANDDIAIIFDNNTDMFVVFYFNTGEEAESFYVDANSATELTLEDTPYTGYIYMSLEPPPLNPGSYNMSVSGSTSQLAAPTSIETSGGSSSGGSGGSGSGSGGSSSSGEQPDPLALLTTFLPQGKEGGSFSRSLAATGGTEPYNWSLASGTIPPGLSLSAAGIVSGTPSGSSAGDYAFTVQVEDSDLQTDSQTLSLTIAPGGGVFTNFTTLSVGDSPEGIALGDLNGDGNLDLVTANSVDGTVSVALESGSGNFSTPVAYPVDSEPCSVLIADMTGDGNPDVVVATNAGASIAVIEGAGNGTLTTETTILSGKYHYYQASMCIDDFNGDGSLDVAAASTLGSFSVILSQGGGAFTTPVHYALGNNCSAIVSGDITGDGQPDLVVTENDAERVYVLSNNGGTFTALTVLNVGELPRHVAIADVDVDGLRDIVVSNRLGNSISIFYGTGGGGFSAVQSIPLGSDQPSYSVIEDINDDNIPDLLYLAYSTSGRLKVRIATEAGIFSIPASSTVGSAPEAMVLGDINNDGKLDVVTANRTDDSVSILLGE